MKKVIYTNKAPDPVGPYNQAVFSNDILYISGQVALNPKNGKMINNSLEDETNQVMNNLKAILNEVDFNFNNVIKSTIYLTNMDYFNQVNEIYGSFFEEEHEGQP